MVGGILACAIAGVSSGQQIPVKAGVTVVPDTVRIGDPFRITVGVRVPLGATIEFPLTTDSTSTVQSLDPVAVRTSADTTAVEQYAVYRVAAWDIGSQPIHLGDAVVHLNGVERHVSLNATAVFVRTLLPTDTAKRVPKPLRDLYVFKSFPWWLVAVIAAAIIAAVLLWWWLRRRGRRVVITDVDPYLRAQSEFRRIDALALLEAGERGRHVALMIEVLRDYLAARYAEAALSLTSTELQRSLRIVPHVPQERLMRVLTEADLIKFARRPVSPDRARELGRDAETIVAEEHAASQPVTAVEAAA